MTVTTLSGAVDTNQALSSELVVDMDQEIQMLHTDETQFTTMLMKLRKRQATQFRSDWLEDQLFPRLTTLAASATSAATTLTVATNTGQYFRAGDLVRIGPSGECVAVSSISTDTLTVTRSIGSVAAATAQSGVDLVIIGNAVQQGDTLGTSLITKKVMGYNYQQIYRTPWRFTNTNIAVSHYGGNVNDFEAAKKLVEHKRGLEYLAFHGARDIDTSTFIHPIGYAGGLDEFVTTNVTGSIGALTTTNMDSWLRSALQNARNPVLFTAPLPMQAISNFLRAAWAPDTSAKNENIYGAKVDGWLSGAYGVGTIPVFVKKDWNDFQTTSGQYGGRIYSVDLSGILYRPLRDTKRFNDRQANDADERASEYLTEFTFEIPQETHHGILTGITS